MEEAPMPETSANSSLLSSVSVDPRRSFCRFERLGPQRTKTILIRRLGRLSVITSLAVSFLQTIGGAQTQTTSASSDHLELGLQGQSMPGDLNGKILPRPYSKGVRLIGHSEILNRDSNMQLAWIDNCAYVSSSQFSTAKMLMGATKANNQSTAGVAVIDVSDPNLPKMVRLLRDRGSIDATETIHAVAATDRK